MPKVIESPAEHAARLGNTVVKWVDDKTASGSEQVLTDATLYQNIGANQTLFITEMTYDLTTLSDNCHFNLVKCAAVAGGGAAVDICGHAHMQTGAAYVTGGSKERTFDPPIRVPYSASALSVSMQIEGNDASAVISCGFHGYLVDGTQ